jgi:Stress responsive A/B Barrel Domain
LIRHIVLARFRHDVAASEIAAVFDDLRRLRQHLPGMLAFHAGPNTSHEGRNRGYSHAFTVDFADAAALAAYDADPAHKAAGARLVAACEGGLDGLLVIDIDC